MTFTAVCDTVKPYFGRQTYPPFTNSSFVLGGQSFLVMLPSSGFVDDGVLVTVAGVGETPKKFGWGVLPFRPTAANSSVVIVACPVPSLVTAF